LGHWTNDNGDRDAQRHTRPSDVGAGAMLESDCRRVGVCNCTSQLVVPRIPSKRGTARRRLSPVSRPPQHQELDTPWCEQHGRERTRDQSPPAAPIYFRENVTALAQSGRAQLLTAPFTEHHQTELPTNVTLATHALTPHEPRSVVSVLARFSNPPSDRRERKPATAKRGRGRPPRLSQRCTTAALEARQSQEALCREALIDGD
jgi:hypothetical protein